MSNGWIKLHRQLRDSSFYGQPIPVAIWIECLLRGAHEGRERFIGREKVFLQPGEFVMGLDEMGETVGCGKATIKSWMDVFEKEGMLDRTPTAKGTICKLKKWSEYQDTRPPMDRARTADGPLADPNKKVKNVRIKETTTGSRVEDPLRTKILKHLRSIGIASPEGYLQSLERKTNNVAAIEKAWNDWNRGGIVGVTDWYARCLHHAGIAKPK